MRTVKKCLSRPAGIELDAEVVDKLKEALEMLCCLIPDEYFLDCSKNLSAGIFFFTRFLSLGCTVQISFSPLLSFPRGLLLLLFRRNIS